MMTMRDRDRLRRLNDRLIDRLERAGVHDNATALLSDGTTLGSLRRFIHPQHEAEIRDYIRELDAESR